MHCLHRCASRPQPFALECDQGSRQAGRAARGTKRQEILASGRGVALAVEAATGARGLSIGLAVVTQVQLSPERISLPNGKLAPTTAPDMRHASSQDPPFARSQDSATGCGARHAEATDASKY